MCSYFSAVNRTNYSRLDLYYAGLLPGYGAFRISEKCLVTILRKNGDSESV